MKIENQHNPKLPLYEVNAQPLRVLLACEESQAVCIELRKLGFEAFSCDTQECSGGHPEWHICDDVLSHLNDGWDCMIAFPPCTHLAVSGAAWFEEKRKDGRQQQGIDYLSKWLTLRSNTLLLKTLLEL